MQVVGLQVASLKPITTISTRRASGKALRASHPSYTISGHITKAVGVIS
jgi:hypothetical protein